MFVKLNKRINKLNSVMGDIDDFISALILYNISNKYDISDKMDKTIEIIKTCQETYLIYVKHESVVNLIIENIIDKKKRPTRMEAARISSFFNYIRRVRNDVGHPTGKSFPRSEVLAMFLPFPSYLENLEKLLNYFKSNPIQ